MSKDRAQILFWFKISCQIVVFILILALLSLFIARSFRSVPATLTVRKRSVLEHLTALRHALRNKNAAIRMQNIFPEGACFTLTLYGLTWTNLARQVTDDKDLRSQAIREAIWIFEQYEKPYVSEFFKDTQVPNGVFRLGQKNLLLGQLLEIMPEDERPREYVEEFHRNSKLLTEAFLQSPTKHLDSYPGLCWPADNVTALLSLFIHDVLYSTDYQQAYYAWKHWTQRNFDPNTGMPAGHLIRDTGELLQPARGCANSWILSLLARMDSEFAKQQYKQYRKHFLIQNFGFRMFREYPKGFNGQSDIDSGPIIWGAGVAATGIGLGASIANGDIETAEDIHNLANMLGWPTYIHINGEKGKRYLLGLLPTGDAFLTWAYSIPTPIQGLSNPPSFWSQIKTRKRFYVISLFLMCLMCIWGYFLQRSFRRKWRLNKSESSENR